MSTKPGEVHYSKCGEKITSSFSKAEEQGAGLCPGGDGDQADIQNFLDVCSVSVASALAGEQPLPADVITCNEALTTCQNPTCGDEQASRGEQCDGTDLNGATCSSLGYLGGTLACSDCAFDTSDCTRCGDGVINPGEQCDPGAAGGGLAGETCESLGYFWGGDLACDNVTCQVDESGCDGVGKIVFSTSTTYDGNLGGVAGADAKCQERADAAGLPGTYKAWISSGNSIDGYVSPSTTFTRSTVPYRRVDGAIVASNWDGLTSGALAAPINVDENGAVVAQGGVWTGTQAPGIPAPTRSGHPFCPLEGNWSSNAPTDGAFAGYLGLTDSGWSRDMTWTCDNFLHLYCFEQ